jgi:fibro-slime domain-containing protein
MRAAARLMMLSWVLGACGSESEMDGDAGPSPTEDGGPVTPNDDAALPQGDGAGPRDTGVRDGYVPPGSATCGNNKLEGDEQCDDGNLAEADGCDASCHRELGFNCPMIEGACVAICGDRMLVAGEACDDGASQVGDGCGETCKVEEGWSCLSSGVPCVASECGDGIIAGLETCDDGNNLPGDGCSTQCTLEAGWVCAVPNTDCAAERCGDAVRAGAELCDDGNVVSGDGCTAACDAVEPNFACPDTGGVCTRTSKCGNGSLTSDEQCDDRNVVSGDGCSSDCKNELGWQCANVGKPCTAAKCGDKILAGGETCEDNNTTPNDGCNNCQVETGWACTLTNMVSSCHRASCGDKKVEGEETCDDGNDVVGDGCGPTCVVEPTCAVGQACVSTCGDGIKLASDVNEQCDDGNVRSGDGCSDKCKIEGGFTCTDVRTTLPASFDLTVTYRDFIREPLNGSAKHPDFDAFSGDNASLGLVGNVLVDGKPTYTGRCEKGLPTVPADCGGGGKSQPQTTKSSSFNQWYSNADIAEAKKLVTAIKMNKQGTTSAYRNATFGSQLFPLDTFGWVATTPKALEPKFDFKDGNGNVTASHNFGFTTEIHHWFEFAGGEVLTFSGDDDVWVFIAGKLALDLGGLHGSQSRTIQLSNNGTVSCFVGTNTSGASCGSTALALTPGRVYEMALFHAERHTNQSNFDLTLNGFVSSKSMCVSKCGDGVITAGEVCDDGSFCVGGSKVGQACADTAFCGTGGTCVSRNDGTYGHCNNKCDDLGPHCGDGAQQASEECDKGFAMNNGGYNTGCTQECKRGPYCGDGKVDGVYQEQCDLGTADNDGGYDGCSASCKFSERCGDGVLQPPEMCDNGTNNATYNGCGPGCVPAPRCGDGVVDRTRGEECDDGLGNDGHYSGCRDTCKRAARCGDRTIDTASGETCDDGNVNNYDGCSATCQQDIGI